MMSVLHKFLGTSVLLPSLSAASNLVQSPLAGAPPPSFYAVLQAVHLWVDAYKVGRDGGLAGWLTRKGLHRTARSVDRGSSHDDVPHHHHTTSHICVYV